MRDSPDGKKKPPDPFGPALVSAICLAAYFVSFVFASGVPGEWLWPVSICAGLGVGCAVSAIRRDSRHLLHTRSFRWAVVLLIAHLLVVYLLMVLVLADPHARNTIFPFWGGVLGF